MFKSKKKIKNPPKPKPIADYDIMKKLYEENREAMDILKYK
ncbi:hypothetical protein ONZ78_01345 [Lactobacillus mulieris]|nr:MULTISPECIES: hypothetical protein [Lactobacillus]MCW8105426.1 hypothetical protein [Lactobacillus mulieris]MDK6563792.1 hypothetical protein [Lactobacillus mulieris]MDK7348154.1 hypothetical protein [Lactobacillus mulieris]MDK8082868.1 hypothetical protein [Lactobacillus mulieris]